MWCPRCGTISRSAVGRVSIRSALFALKKEGILDQDAFKRLDRDWSRYRKEHALDANGQTVAAPSASGVEIACSAAHDDEGAGP
jgi:hypothetical protein